VGYDNLKKSQHETTRTLATDMNKTTQDLVVNNLYIKKNNSKIDWNKAVEGTKFYERTSQWVSNKEQKIEHMRNFFDQQVTNDCTFQPEKSVSPRRKRIVKSFKTANTSPTASRLVQNAYMPSPI
jgi:hypothetical protein